MRTRPRYYVLDEHGEAKPERDVLVWAEWLERAGDSRRVAQDHILGVEVSTVFLGLDHQWFDGPPLIYETMIFAGDDWTEQNMWRYSTRADALRGHAVAVAMVRRELRARPKRPISARKKGNGDRE